MLTYRNYFKGINKKLIFEGDCEKARAHLKGDNNNLNENIIKNFRWNRISIIARTYKYMYNK